MRVPATESEEPDRATWRPHLGPNEPVQPSAVNGESVSEERSYPVGVRSAQEDHLAARRNRGIEGPRPGERPAWRRLAGPRTPTLSGGRDVRGRAGLEGGKRGVVEAVPEFDLPVAVKVLQSRLEARVVDRRDHRGQRQLEAEPRDAPDRVRGVVAPWKQVSLSNCATSGRPTVCEPVWSPATTRPVVTPSAGQASTNPACRVSPARTSTAGPPRKEGRKEGRGSGISDTAKRADTRSALGNFGTTGHCFRKFLPQLRRPTPPGGEPPSA